MKILGSSAIVRSTDREGAVRRFAALFGASPLHEFPIEGRDLDVSVFPGVSVLSGPASALAELADLRASVFVGSVAEAEVELREAGWTTEGALGGGASLLARDSDGNLLEFVENPGAQG
jgi:outer membrane protein TolC